MTSSSSIRNHPRQRWASVAQKGDVVRPRSHAAAVPLRSTDMKRRATPTASEGPSAVKTDRCQKRSRATLPSFETPSEVLDGSTAAGSSVPTLLQEVGTNDGVAQERAFVDRSLFVHQWWTSCYHAELILRPRGCGKSFALSMVKYVASFCETFVKSS